MAITLANLKEAGFRCDVQWRQSKIGVNNESADFPASPGLYLFVLDSSVMYVGSALRSLDKRIRRYRTSRSTRPVYSGLAKAIEGGNVVEVYTLPIPSGEQTIWAGLPVSVILGIEAALIRDIDPQWNRRGRELLLDTEDVNSDQEG